MVGPAVNRSAQHGPKGRRSEQGPVRARPSERARRQRRPPLSAKFGSSALANRSFVADVACDELEQFACEGHHVALIEPTGAKLAVNILSEDSDRFRVVDAGSGFYCLCHGCRRRPIKIDASSANVEIAENYVAPPAELRKLIRTTPRTRRVQCKSLRALRKVVEQAQRLSSRSDRRALLRVVRCSPAGS